MVILGLLLVAASVAAGAEIVMSNTETVGGEAFTQVMSDATPATFLLTGAVLGFLTLLGLMMMFGGFGRARKRKVAAKHAVRRVEDDKQQIEQDRQSLAEENDRLRNELLEERRQRATLGGVAVPPGMGDTPYGDQVGDAVRSNTISDTGRYDPYPGDPDRSTVVEPRADAPREQPRMRE